ncbi:hypothetical protein MED01_006405 [Micromonospora sp. MED01]|uniref:hypothetical protein n=1 Tax=Micromonospora alfalfae TaxID=2911212 RepID=UPI001EE8886D|nr:hypothetical protein [Micromonospora alfalfae]MCG5461542.1 hypothetical protein [Micromonospora alfalfae]
MGDAARRDERGESRREQQRQTWAYEVRCPRCRSSTGAFLAWAGVVEPAGPAMIFLVSRSPGGEPPAPS